MTLILLVHSGVSLSHQLLFKGKVNLQSLNQWYCISSYSINEMGNMLWETLKDEHSNPYKTSPLLYSLSPLFQFINSRLLSPLNWIWLVKAHYNSFWLGHCFMRLQQCASFSVTSKQQYKCRAAKMLIKPNHLTIHRRYCVVNNTVSVAWLQRFNSKTVYFCLVCALGHQWRHKFIKSLLWHYE